MRVLAVLILVSSFNSMAFKCMGNEPSWSADVTNTSVSLTKLGQSPIALQVSSVTAVAGQQLNYMSTYLNQNGPVAVVTKRSCSDSMSGDQFPREILIFTGSETLYGCCHVRKKVFPRSRE